MVDERRVHPRLGQAVPVRIKFGGTDDFLRAYTENVSLGGVFVATAVDVPIGTRVELTVELMEGKGFQVGAEVAWRRSPGSELAAGVGLRFIELEPRHERWLRKASEDYLVQHQKELQRSLEADHQLRTGVGGNRLVEPEINVANLGFETGDDPVLGIDLGTCNSCVCVYWEGQPKILDLSEGAVHDSKSVPSVVAYNESGQPIVGYEAQQGLAANPKRTIFGSKRFIGRTYDNPDVQTMLARYPYKVVPGPGRRAAVEINGRPLNLSSVAGKILSHIKRLAEQKLEMPLSRAVITVPAYYNQNQREAVVQAARLAGLTVQRILNEPTAAAIAYGLSYSTPHKILVYDLGGGTFDVSVMAVADKTLSVLSTAGDTFLGGEDFDNVIVGQVIEKYEQITSNRLSRNHSAIALLKIAAEKAKCRLTLHEKTMVTVREAVLADGRSERLEVEITREDVERWVQPLVDRTIKICEMAMGEAKLHPGSIDDVILVGGQTLMPYVQRRVKEFFAKTPRYDLRADEVVALGAGLLTQMDREEVSDLKDALSMSIGIELGGGRFKKLIERNTPVPCRRSHRIEVPANRVAGTKLEVYQGEAPEVSRNEHLGTVRMEDLDPGESDPVPLKIDFLLSPDCLLKVQVTNLSNEESVDVLLDTRDTE